MKAALALALACLMLANGVLAAGGRINKYQPRQGRRLSALSRRGLIEAYQAKQDQGHRRLLALLPSLGGSGSSGSGNTTSPKAPSGKSSSKVVTTTLAYGESVVACKAWDPESLTWDWPSNPTEYTATGKTQPAAADVKKLTSLICSDPEAAGDQIRTGVQAGGAQAQTAVYAMFAADCTDDEAVSDAYGTAIDAVNGGDPAKIDQVSSWFTNFAKAADEVGVPVCMSLALVDPATGEAADTRDFHASGPAPKGGSRSSGGSSLLDVKSGGRR